MTGSTIPPLRAAAVNKPQRSATSWSSSGKLRSKSSGTGRQTRVFYTLDSVLTITVFSMGKPVASLTGNESVVGIKICGDQTLNQNPRPVTANPSYDLVSVGLFSQSKVTDPSLVRRVFQENAYKAVRK